MSTSTPSPVSTYPAPPSNYAERMRIYLRNRPNFPIEELLRHAGQCVAFSWDGLAIVAAAADLPTLETKLVDAGINPEHVSFGSIPADDEISLGGTGLEVDHTATGETIAE